MISELFLSRFLWLKQAHSNYATRIEQVQKLSLLRLCRAWGESMQSIDLSRGRCQKETESIQLTTNREQREPTPNREQRGSLLPLCRGANVPKEGRETQSASPRDAKHKKEDDNQSLLSLCRVATEEDKVYVPKEGRETRSASPKDAKHKEEKPHSGLNNQKAE